MLLTVFERLLLRNIVPQIQGWNYAHMKEARELIEGLFTEQEEIDLQIHNENDGKSVKWNLLNCKECIKHNQELWKEEWKTMFPENSDTFPDIPCTGIPISQERDISVSDGLVKKIGKFLKQLDREEKLGFEHMTFYEKMTENTPAS